MNIAILILAAGSSSRMKTSKQLLPINNNTLLGVAIEHALSTKTKEVFCVLGANYEKINQAINAYDIKVIKNPNYKKGLSTSIIKGIEHIQSYKFDAVLITLADQPKVDSNYLNTLIGTWAKHPEKIIASSYNTAYGVPAIFPKETFKSLLNLKGDKGAKQLLNSELHKVIGIESKHLFDIDTLEDYKAYLKVL